MMKQIKVLTLAALLSTASYGADAMRSDGLGEDKKAGVSQPFRLALTGKPDEDLKIVDEAIRVREAEFKRAKFAAEATDESTTGAAAAAATSASSSSVKKELDELTKLRDSIDAFFDWSNALDKAHQADKAKKLALEEYNKAKLAAETAGKEYRDIWTKKMPLIKAYNDLTSSMRGASPQG